MLGIAQATTIGNVVDVMPLIVSLSIDSTPEPSCEATRYLGVKSRDRHVPRPHNSCISGPALNVI
jgi:hypothetical protein